jgi:hypothetical protein
MERVPDIDSIVLLFSLALSISHISMITKDIGCVERISQEMVTFCQAWTSILLLLIFAVIQSSQLVSPLINLISLAFACSGCFIENPIAQTIYHIASTCSWIGCFDMYLRSSGGNLNSLLDWNWILVIYMTSSIVVRAYSLNSWQFSSIPHLYVGISLISLYYWGFERFLCGDLSVDNCALMRSPPPRLAHCGIDDHYQVLFLFTIVFGHMIFGRALSFFLRKEVSLSFLTENSLERGKSRSESIDYLFLPPIPDSSPVPHSPPSLVPSIRPASPLNHSPTKISALSFLDALISKDCIQSLSLSPPLVSREKDRCRRGNPVDALASSIATAGRDKTKENELLRSSFGSKPNGLLSSLPPSACDGGLSRGGVGVGGGVGEISEAEAIDIVQRGLMTLRTKRAT